MSTPTVENMIDCVVPVPVRRTRKKIKLKMDCTHENGILDIIVPPKRTKKKLRDLADPNLKINMNDKKNGTRLEKITVVEEPNVYYMEGIINEDFAKDIDCNSNKIISAPSISNGNCPKIVKLIEKSGSDSNETNIIVNSIYKADSNNVPKFKMNILNKMSTVGFGKIQRDSEDDSGVYFSDSTKVSPTKLNSDMDTLQKICFNKSENDHYVYVDDAFCIKPQPDVHNNNNNNNNNYIITSDSVDNKNETNLGPLKQVDSSVVNPLVSVLDSFEAEILNKFKESKFTECGFNLTKENEKPFLGESLSRYLEGILSVSENSDCSNCDVKVASGDLESKCNRNEISDSEGSKVYKETVSETCYNIFQCVSSNSRDDLDSTVKVDYSSTNLGFVVNEYNSPDILDNTVINAEVNVTEFGNDYESTREIYLSNSDNNSPVNENEFSSVDSVPPELYELNLPVNQHLSIKNEQSAEPWDVATNKYLVENSFNEINNRVIVNNNKNKVKSLINFFESIVQSTVPLGSDDKDNYDNHMIANSNVDDFSFVKNVTVDDQAHIDENKQEEKQDNEKKKTGKCVSFSDHLVIINDAMERRTSKSVSFNDVTCTISNVDDASSASSEEVINESPNNLNYDRLMVSDDSSELFSSFSSDEPIEETCVEILPLINPPDESRLTKILENISNNKCSEINTNLFLCENNFNRIENLWANKSEDSVYHTEESVKSYFSFIEQNGFNQNQHSIPTELVIADDLLFRDSELIHDSVNVEKNIYTLREHQNLCNTEMQINQDHEIDNKPELASSDKVNGRTDEIPSFGYIDNTGENLFEVSLEKVWGSIGVKLEVVLETGQLFISDLLPGGAADSCGFIAKGVIKFLI